MNYRIVIIFTAAMLILSGCRGRKDQDTAPDSQAAETQTLETQETAQTSGTQETQVPDIKDAPEVVVEITPAEPEILHFVDVFGQEYEVEINENVVKTPYDNSGFDRSGKWLKYEDDEYTSVFGIDVSKHQGSIDWKSVKEAGAEFVILRIGYRGYGPEGSLQVDERFKSNIEGAKSEGLDVGVYFFAQAVNEEEAREEAEFVLKNLSGYDLELPIVYDPESILDAEARTDNVTGEQFTKNTQVFCKTIQDAGYSPMIYANMLWEAYELDLSKLSGYPVWYADYEEYPQTPYMYEYWQYSNEGRISGISGEVDLNIRLVKKQ